MKISLQLFYELFHYGICCLFSHFIFFQQFSNAIADIGSEFRVITVMKFLNNSKKLEYTNSKSSSHNYLLKKFQKKIFLIFMFLYLIALQSKFLCNFFK